MRKYILFLIATASLSLLSSCAAKPEQPTQPQQEYRLIATIKDIMDSEVDPSADYIWDSVGTFVSAEGTLQKAPKTDDDWKEERRRAIILVEAANLLTMPGRHVAKPGEKSENPGIELGPEEIEALINMDRPTFVKLAYEFQDLAIEQLRVVDARDVDGLLKVGGDLDKACENCHRKYWYPNEPVFPEPEATPAPESKPSPVKK